ncbi:hypothetical protein BC830DRAFT_526281 [Chytriomyces sp. MP71]|nr:hypothetical protein BC830DRAFT_526281 [Chytriomyces sp. MP71]
MEERLSKSSDGRNMSSHGGRPSKAELIAQMFAGQGICGEASGAWDKADAGKDLGHPADENVDPAAFALYRDNVMTLAELDSVPASSSPFTASIPSASISYLAPFSTPMRHITIAKPADLSFLQDLQEKLKSFTITTPKPAHVLQQQRDAQFDLYASPAFNKLLQENKECDEQVLFVRPLRLAKN